MIRSIDPIVSADWLEDQLGKEGLVVIDVRPEEQYKAGHIPGAVSVPFGLVSAWADSGELTLELPAEEGLVKTIGECGITADSRVVIAGSVPEPGVPPYALADSVRVATTLICAGVKNTAVLAGGHAKWAHGGKETAVEVPAVTPVCYGGALDGDSWVSTEYVKSCIGRSVIIDGRDPNEYFGASVGSFGGVRGHIPTARCLPLIWVWEEDGTYRAADLIENMAVGVAGRDKDREIICYCGAGGYASAWWFLLTQMLCYSNVKIYDGSMEAWAREGNPTVSYTWTE